MDMMDGTTINACLYVLVVKGLSSQLHSVVLIVDLQLKPGEEDDNGYRY